MSVEKIAREHHISVRHLYKLWACHELSLGRWIIRERLEGARRDLAGSRHRAATVAAIAHRWGLQLPLGKPTQFQLEEAKQRGPANGTSAPRAAGPQVDAPQASAARMAVATTAAIPAAPATPAAPGDRAAVATTRLRDHIGRCSVCSEVRHTGPAGILTRGPSQRSFGRPDLRPQEPADLPRSPPPQWAHRVHVRQAAANGADALPKLRPRTASGDFDDYRAHHSGKNTSAPTRPATATT